MNLSAATNQQLKIIMNYDRYCPKHLLKEVVHEMLNRGMLKNFAMYHSRRYFGIVRSRETKLGLEDSDIIQLGYIGILKALEKYEVGKSSFSAFSLYYMQAEWQGHMRKFNAEKRTMDRESVSTEVEINGEGETLREFLPSTDNVEKTVLMKMYFESQIEKLTKLQKTAIFGYIRGYDMKEIAKTLKQPRQSVERAFHRAVEKMGGERISLRDHCGVKGA